MTPISPRIIYISPKILIEENSKANLVCVGQGYPKVNYYWFKDDFNLINQYDYKYLSNQYLLKIENARVHDSGKYTCLINNTEGIDKREIEVLVRAKIWVSLNPVEQIIRTGQSVILNCSILGFPIKEITWFKNGLPLSKYKKTYKISSNIIKIGNVQREDQGIYQCFVKNEFETVQASASLIHGGKY